MPFWNPTQSLQYVECKLNENVRRPPDSKPHRFTHTFQLNAQEQVSPDVLFFFQNKLETCMLATIAVMVWYHT